MGVYANARKATEERIVGTFWESYKIKPIEQITVKELTASCGIGRGTFYIHFQDVHAVLERIESDLSSSLERVRAYLDGIKNPSQNDFGKALYELYSDEKEKEYLNILILNRRDPFFAQNFLLELREMMYSVCLKENALFGSDREKMLLDCAVSSMINIILDCVCNTDLDAMETDQFIRGILQNGYYVTLTNMFGIDVLKNPFV